MSTKEEAIQKAIDTLAELCDRSMPLGESETEYARREEIGSRRMAAEEILRHYREDRMVDHLKHIQVTINGSVPVRPMTRSEVSA